MNAPNVGPTQRFTLGEVLSITTGKLMAPMEKVYTILNWMTDDSLFTHQLPRAATECEPWLLRWFPALKEVDVTDVNGDNHPAKLAALVAKHGDVFDVPRIPKDDHAVKDAIEELAAMVGHDRIVVLHVDGKPLDVLADPLLVWDDYDFAALWYGHLEEPGRGVLYRIEVVSGGFFVGRQLEPWGDYEKLAVVPTVKEGKAIAERDAQQRHPGR